MQPTSDGYRIFVQGSEILLVGNAAQRVFVGFLRPPIPFLFVFSLLASFVTLRSFIPYFEHTLALLGKTVVMSAMRNLRKRCPESHAHVQKPAAAAVRNTAFI